jgi:uncharacterized membrane protein
MLFVIRCVWAHKAATRGQPSYILLGAVILQVVGYLLFILLLIFQRTHSAAHQAAIAAIAKAKQAKAAASAAAIDQQSPAEVQQHDRSNRGGRVNSY